MVASPAKTTFRLFGNDDGPVRRIPGVSAFALPTFSGMTGVEQPVDVFAVTLERLGVLGSFWKFTSQLEVDV